MNTKTLERHNENDTVKMQWRGSNDGIVWTPWRPLVALTQKVDYYLYYQGRAFINGRWLTSLIERDEP